MVFEPDAACEYIICSLYDVGLTAIVYHIEEIITHNVDPKKRKNQKASEKHTQRGLTRRSKRGDAQPDDLKKKKLT